MHATGGSERRRRGLLQRPAWAALPLVALLAGLLVLWGNWGGGLDQALRTWRDGLRQHDAPPGIAIVEIDAKSLRALNQWPWPRRYHARLVDRLNAAGASLVAFDVNFAVQSNPTDDAALTAALQRAGGLVALPTFQEFADFEGSEVVEALPYEPFRNNAFLGGVNIVADPDGMVRRLPLGTETAGTPRPSMASLLAETQGDVDQMVEIDYSIDPASIQRFSFIDILNGNFDPSQIEGKRLIVGGTAADMEDRYTVPIHGVLPGVVVQSLGAATIMAGGMPVTASGLWPLLLVLLVAVGLALTRRRTSHALLIAAGLMVVIALPLATEHWLTLSFAIAPALAALAVAAAGALALDIRERFRERSVVDAETGLPNLRALVADLEQGPTGQAIVARVDRFAAIAAGLGPDATVALVQRIAERLRCGSDRRTIYRIDDHSLAWTASGDAQAELDDQLSALAALMRSPIECGRLVDVTIGLGVAQSCTNDKGRADAKQQVANAALAAERSLRDKLPFRHFADGDGEETGWHLSLLGELSAAMADGDVWNAYQPKLDIASGHIVGVETLVRWNHRERGPVGPDRFIPVVEASGRAAELTAHVFSRALADAADWRAKGHDLSVAVNVSATLLEDERFIVWLAETLRISCVPAAKVTIEVTESAAVKDVEQAAAALEAWRALGLAISIDDYGTGQSSLGYLQRLPATELKIDKSFIQTVAEDPRNAIMVRSTVALAHQLGMKVVAEGVETVETLDALRDMGCDVAQGWLIGRPICAADLEALLSNPPALAA